jgi:hypothetical protein
MRMVSIGDELLINSVGFGQFALEVISDHLHKFVFECFFKLSPKKHWICLKFGLHFPVMS